MADTIIESGRLEQGNGVINIDISSYTSQNNPFLCPCDGYIFIYIPKGSSGKVKFNQGNGMATKWIYGKGADDEVRDLIFVRKGYRIYFTENSTTRAEMYFRAVY